MAEKEFEQEDPFALVRMFTDAPADDVYWTSMARTFIEEFALMGWKDEDILGLFRDPFYRASHEIWKHNGEPFVRNLISEVRNG